MKEFNPLRVDNDWGKLTFWAGPDQIVDGCFLEVKWGLTDVSTHLVCCREISVPLGQLGMPDKVKSQIPFIRIPVYGSSLDVDLRTLPGNVQLRVWDDV